MPLPAFISDISWMSPSVCLAVQVIATDCHLMPHTAKFPNSNHGHEHSRKSWLFELFSYLPLSQEERHWLFLAGHLRCSTCELATFLITHEAEGGTSFSSSPTTDLTAVPGTGLCREPCGDEFFRTEIPLTPASCWQLALLANGTYELFQVSSWSFVCSCLFSFSLDESV